VHNAAAKTNLSANVSMLNSNTSNGGGNLILKKHNVIKIHRNNNCGGNTGDSD
jgi:hypothetical protein